MTRQDLQQYQIGCNEKYTLQSFLYLLFIMCTTVTSGVLFDPKYHQRQKCTYKEINFQDCNHMILFGRINEVGEKKKRHISPTFQVGGLCKKAYSFEFDFSIQTWIKQIKMIHLRRRVIGQIYTWHKLTDFSRALSVYPNREYTSQSESGILPLHPQHLYCLYKLPMKYQNFNWWRPYVILIEFILSK